MQWNVRLNKKNAFIEIFEPNDQRMKSKARAAI